MTERERLIELLNKKQDVGIVYNESQIDSRYSESKEISNDELADYLIENGVIVPPVKVGDTAYKLGWTTCKNGESYPENEYFSVDDVYEVIGRVLDGVPEDIEFK